ncbi:MAG: glucosamine-6-phosphate deaminase [Actinomycetia bacterium]|nr:glucosamine-6-phosphate deaminase [Actinomycetes bacterium]
MEIVITPDPQAAAVVAADAIERLLLNNTEPVLGLATGSSPLPTYQELIARYRSGRITFANGRAFLLDEYVGLEVGHREAYRTFIQRELTDQVDLPANALFGPDGNTVELATAAERYEQLISDVGGIDLQLLGIGSDGHIGFNEPTSSLGSRTRLKTLTDATRTDNARFSDDDISAVPRHVLTQGIGTILEADHLILLASGASKARPIAQAVVGPLMAMMPASALHLHPHATVIIDEAAAEELSHSDYYREAFANKPAWQHI